MDSWHTTLWRLSSGSRKERDQLVENISLLISSGMSILAALDAMAEEPRSRRMKNALDIVRRSVEAGFPLWRALAEARVLPEQAISLIRLGEESGKLAKNLAVVVAEREKDAALRSKLRSAMLYPVFVLALTVVIGIGVAWFILPRLAIVFAQIKLELPLITKILIAVGLFLRDYGAYVVPPATLGIVLLGYVVFVFPATKRIGQTLLFALPGTNRLIQEMELARFGYLLGTLLGAGMPITKALDSLSSATEFWEYRALYAHLRDALGEGSSFQEGFAGFRHANALVPISVERLIIEGERSGSLVETLLKVGSSFEAKADTTAKNLAVILEPIMLIIVWLGVLSVALGVIMPIYGLIGGLGAS